MRGAYFEGMVHEHALLSSDESSEVVQLYFVLRVRYQADFDRPETPARRHGECARGQARVAARARAGRRGAPRARFARGAGAAARAVFVGVAGSHGRTVKRNRIMIGHVYAIYIAAIRSDRLSTFGLTAHRWRGGRTTRMRPIPDPRNSIRSLYGTARFTESRTELRRRV